MKAKHYPALDALRLVAALAVMVYHRRMWLGLPFFEHAYLAVDFFFWLSGFVIAHAYESRLISGMTPAEFGVIRVVRLYPLLVAGAVAGFLGLLVHQTLAGGSVLALWLVLPFAVLCLPDLTFSSDDAFPLLPPSWSLFFELAANFAYAWIVKKLTDRRLCAVVAVAGIGLLWICWFNGSAEVGNTHKTLVMGIPRVIFPFFGGVLIYRLKENFLRLRTNFIVLTLMLLAAFLPVERHWWYDALCIAVLFPLLVILGSVVRLTDRAARLAMLSGELSYPVYLLHIPVYLGTSLVAGKLGLSNPVALILACLATLVVSYLALRYFDRPVRNFLARASRAHLVRSTA